MTSAQSNKMILSSSRTFWREHLSRSKISRSLKFRRHCYCLPHGLLTIFEDCTYAQICNVAHLHIKNPLLTHSVANSCSLVLSQCFLAHGTSTCPAKTLTHWTLLSLHTGHATSGHLDFQRGSKKEKSNFIVERKSTKSIVCVTGLWHTPLLKSQTSSFAWLSYMLSVNLIHTVPCQHMYNTYMLTANVEISTKC